MSNNTKDSFNRKMQNEKEEKVKKCVRAVKDVYIRDAKLCKYNATDIVVMRNLNGVCKDDTAGKAYIPKNTKLEYYGTKDIEGRKYAELIPNLIYSTMSCFITME